MIQLRDKSNNTLIGTIDDDQLRFLMDELEEEWMEDRDYAITPLLVNYFDELGAQPELVSMLREALGDREEIEVIWSRV